MLVLYLFVLVCCLFRLLAQQERERERGNREEKDTKLAGTNHTICEVSPRTTKVSRKIILGAQWTTQREYSTYVFDVYRKGIPKIMFENPTRCNFKRFPSNRGSRPTFLAAHRSCQRMCTRRHMKLMNLPYQPDVHHLCYGTIP